ncbi:MAG: DUF3788 family protein [Thermodesulfobacteriota bacterium]|nr:DUF3788 family protein [Thermodesulfobacteriota bacterium]
MAGPFRYKKSKSFCTLIPEKNHFSLLIVFGAKKRAKVEAMEETYRSTPKRTMTKPQHITMENGCFSQSIQKKW